MPRRVILYPPARRGTLAGQARGARPDHKGRAQGGPAFAASVRPPGHARPRTSQDTGQTIPRRSRPAHATAAQMHRRKGVIDRARNARLAEEKQQKREGYQPVEMSAKDSRKAIWPAETAKEMAAV